MSCHPQSGRRNQMEMGGVEGGGTARKKCYNKWVHARTGGTEGPAQGTSLHTESRALSSFCLAPHRCGQAGFAPYLCLPPLPPPPPSPAAHWCQLWGICIAQVLWFLTPDLPVATGIPYRSVTQLTERETMAFYISPGYQEPALSELCFSISLTLHCASLYQLQC